MPRQPRRSPSRTPTYVDNYPCHCPQVAIEVRCFTTVKSPAKPVDALQPVRSFRQARLSQSICMLCGVFWMTKRAQYILQIGNSQCRVNLKQSRHQSLRFLATPSKRTACGSDTQCHGAVRQLSQCHLCARQSFIMTASREMSVRDPLLHTEDIRI